MTTDTQRRELLDIVEGLYWALLRAQTYCAQAIETSAEIQEMDPGDNLVEVDSNLLLAIDSLATVRAHVRAATHDQSDAQDG